MVGVILKQKHDFHFEKERYARHAYNPSTQEAESGGS
jgi:hypothetical protein